MEDLGKIDHKRILAERMAARFGPPTILKGLGAGFAAPMAGVLPAFSQTAQSGHIKIAALPHAWKLELLDEIEIVDPLTIRLKFSEPYAFLSVALTGSTGCAGTIVSPAATEKYGKDYGRNPVGIGPFKFISWKDNDAIELEANPDYFEPGLPKLAQASFLMIDEPAAAVAC